MNIEKQAKEKIESICNSLTSNNYNCAEIIKKQFNYETTVTHGKEKIKLLVYFGKKGIKTLLQGNTETALYEKLQEYISDNYQLQFKKEDDIFYSEYIGTDETGKGDYFGPLVVCAMYVDAKTQVFLQNIGVKDSKELSDTQINIIAKKIRTELPEHFNIILITPEKYNKLYESFNNVNKLLDWAHSKSIENLLNKFNCTTVITDKFSKNDLTISNKPEYSKIEFIQTHKAERYIGVAAASILARNSMNYWFHNQKQEGFDIPKGASEKVKEYAKRILKKFGIEKLRSIAKLHFKTTNQILEDF